MKQKVVFLCSSKEETRERLGYANAFRYLNFNILYAENEIVLKSVLEKENQNILCVIHPDPAKSFHSIELWKYNIPNIIFQFDTYTLIQQRIEASKPYDVQVVCHAGFDELYKNSGCKHVLTLPHCIDGILLNKIDNAKTEVEKIFEIGWVGRADGNFYEERREVLQLIKNNDFVTNETEKNYTWKEMFNVFKQSKLVVNVSRDDFSCDANLRCFEAMGCGALLLTKTPTELAQFGFVEGKDFIGYNSLQDLLLKIKYCLDNWNKLNIIAKSAQKIILQHHTYLQRVSQLIHYLSTNHQQLLNDNIFRSKNEKQQMFQLAFSFYKDQNLQQFVQCFLKTDFVSKTKLASKLIILVLKNLKRKF